MKGLFYKPIQSNMAVGNNGMKYKNNKNKLAWTNSISRDKALSGPSLKSIFSIKKNSIVDIISHQCYSSVFDK